MYCTTSSWEDLTCWCCMCSCRVHSFARGGCSLFPCATSIAMFFTRQFPSSFRYSLRQHSNSLGILRARLACNVHMIIIHTWEWDRSNGRALSLAHMTTSSLTSLFAYGYAWTSCFSWWLYLSFWTVGYVQVSLSSHASLRHDDKQFCEKQLCDNRWQEMRYNQLRKSCVTSKEMTFWGPLLQFPGLMKNSKLFTL